MTPEQFVSIHQTLSELMALKLPDERINQTVTMAKLHIETLLNAVQEAANVLKAQDDRILQLQKDYQSLETSYHNLAEG